MNLPQAKIKPMRWPLVLIWAVPVLAAIAGIIYFFEYRSTNAREIVIRFSNADGLKIGQTPVNYRGVTIGVVSALELAPDRSTALVHVELHKSALDFARQGTLFWIERAGISGGAISGLTTVISGPYINSIPGTGPPATEFAGLDAKPADRSPGLRIAVQTPRLEHLQTDSPVYFRGIQVGAVENIQLDAVASTVQIDLLIWQRYQNLVRADSQFWIESGIDVSGGLLTGVKMNLESLRTIIAGGIAFATPDAKTPPAQDGDQFILHDQPNKDWLAWSPNLVLPPATTQGGEHQ